MPLWYNQGVTVMYLIMMPLWCHHESWHQLVISLDDVKCQCGKYNHYATVITLWCRCHCVLSWCYCDFLMPLWCNHDVTVISNIILMPLWCHYDATVIPSWCYCVATMNHDFTVMPSWCQCCDVIMMSLWYLDATMMYSWCHCDAIMMPMWYHRPLWCHYDANVIPLWCYHNESWFHCDSIIMTLWSYQLYHCDNIMMPCDVMMSL